MKTRKHLIKISYGFAAVLIIVLGGFLMYQQRQIRQMSQNEAPAPTKEQAPLAGGTRNAVNAQTASVDERGTEQLAAEVDNLRYQLEASEEELDMAREDLVNEQDGPGDVAEFIAMEEKMRENPTLMNMRRRDTANYIGQTYGALFVKLGLCDEKIEALKTLMADHQLQAQEGSLNLMDQSLSEEERKETIQQIGDQKAQFEKQMKDLLGTQDYGAYEAYEERTRERSYVTGLFETLSADLGLSGEKEEELIDAMYEARRKVEGELMFDPKDVSETGGLGLNSWDVMSMEKAILDSYIESARDVLSESQAGEFETRMNEQKEMMKMNSYFLPDIENES